jgi:hypothetical protein
MILFLFKSSSSSLVIISSFSLFKSLWFSFFLN